MKKSKVNDAVKAAAASVLSIGLFSAALIGSTNLVLAKATSKTITVEPPMGIAEQTETVGNVLSASYPEAEVTITYDTDDVPGSGELSAEEAAELGAKYIWELFGEDIDGSMIDMNYTYESSGGGRWNGTAAESEANFNNREILFRFAINSETGERISSFDLRDRSGQLTEKNITREEITNIQNESPYNLDYYAKLAEKYAKIHFSETNVVSVSYDDMKVNITGRDVDGDTFTYDETVLYFTATDENGKNAEISISMETEGLIGISSRAERTERESDQADRDGTRTRNDYSEDGDYERRREEIIREREER